MPTHIGTGTRQADNQQLDRRAASPDQQADNQPQQADNQPNNVPGASANPKINVEGSGTQGKRKREKGRRKIEPTIYIACNVADQDMPASMLQIAP